MYKLNLQLCPKCGELYDISTKCNSDKCRAPSYDKQLAVYEQTKRIVAALPPGAVKFGSCQVIDN